MNMEFHATAKSASSQQNQKVMRRMVNKSMNTKNDSCPPPIDSIVQDEFTRSVLEELNLMPSSWSLPEDEQRRIVTQNLKLYLVKNLSGTPARHAANRVSPRQPKIEISKEFLESASYGVDEKRATIIHELGHEVNPPANEISSKPMIGTSADEIADYMQASSSESQVTKDADIDELYADDYARYCGLQDALRSALYKLYEQEESFKSNSTLQRIARLECHETPLLLNLVDN